jgi:hypothetical protein
VEFDDNIAPVKLKPLGSKLIGAMPKKIVVGVRMKCSIEGKVFYRKSFRKPEYS